MQAGLCNKDGNDKEVVNDYQVVKTEETFPTFQKNCSLTRYDAFA